MRDKHIITLELTGDVYKELAEEAERQRIGTSTLCLRILQDWAECDPSDEELEV